MSEQQQDPHPVHVSLEVPDAHKGGVWANMARVSHSPYEFTLDFARIDFSAGGPEMNGVVVARVNLSPLMVTQLIEALETNWANYAQKSMPREVNGPQG